MIVSFKDGDTARFYDGERIKRFDGMRKPALRKLDMVNAAATLGDLRSPPGNHLEALSGNRAGQHSIRINDQWRVCFVWTREGPADVEIVDYHRG